MLTRTITILTRTVTILNNSPSDFKSRVKQLRELIQIKRKPKRVQKHYVELPTEIWNVIINLVLKQNHSSRYSLQRVNRLLQEIVNKTPTPRLYLNPDQFGNIPVSPISIRRNISIVGSGSGLVQAIREVITHSSLANAWLFLRIATCAGIQLTEFGIDIHGISTVILTLHVFRFICLICFPNVQPRRI